MDWRSTAAVAMYLAGSLLFVAGSALLLWRELGK